MQNPETAEDTKPWYTSKGVLGSVMTVASIVVAMIWGVQIDAETQQTIVTQVALIVGAVGSLVSLIGRLVATKRIG